MKIRTSSKTTRSGSSACWRLLSHRLLLHGAEIGQAPSMTLCLCLTRLGRFRLKSFTLCLSFSLATEINIDFVLGFFRLGHTYIFAREHNFVGDCIQFLCHHVQMSQSRNTIELGN